MTDTDGLTRGEGVSLRRWPDGREERIGWRSVTGETRGRLYSARRYADGSVAYIVNGKIVPSLPRTPIANRVREAFLSEPW